MSTPASAASPASCTRSRGYFSKSSSGPNWLGFTKIDITTTSARLFARRTSETCPSCRAPIVGTKASFFSFACAARDATFMSSMVSIDLITSPAQDRGAPARARMPGASFPSRAADPPLSTGPRRSAAEAVTMVPSRRPSALDARGRSRETRLGEPLAESLSLTGGEVVGLLLRREGARAHVGGESLQRFDDDLPDVGVPADELRRRPLGQAEKIVEDEDLP